MIGAHVDAGGLRWNVRQQGSGPDLVCIHGAGASLESWDALMPLLEDEFRITRMDLPGHADSEALPVGQFRLSVTAEVLAALCCEIDIERPLVLGHSAGGAIALHWAASGHWPQPGRLLAINPALLPFSGIAGVTFPTLAKLAAWTPFLDHAIASRARKTSEVARLIEGTGSRLTGPEMARYQGLMARPSHVRAVLEMMAGWRLDGLLSAWQRSGIELDVLVGDRDRAVPPERTREALAGCAEVVTEPHLGHLAHEEAPQVVAAWVRNVVGLEQEHERYG